MKSFKSFLAESVDEAAFDFIQCLTSSGGPSSAKCKLSGAARNYLKQTVSKDLNLYRGIAIIPQRIDSKNIEALKNLKVGDKLPSFLSKAYGNFASYSKKKSVANYYSKGKLQIITKGKVPKTKIIADLEKLSGDIWADDMAYFKDDKEVIVEEPVDVEIISIKGSL
jgi:hypothetical protein